MADEPQTVADQESGDTIACLQSPQLVCNRVGQNSTFTHTACLGGGTYTYIIKWGDMGGDLSIAGITLANEESVTFSHTYESEGIYETFFNASVSFMDGDSKLWTTEMPVWEVQMDSCRTYQTDQPTTSPVPTQTPTEFVTSSGVKSSPAVVVSMLLVLVVSFLRSLRA